MGAQAGYPYHKYSAIHPELYTPTRGAGQAAVHPGLARAIDAPAAARSEIPARRPTATLAPIALLPSSFILTSAHPLQA